MRNKTVLILIAMVAAFAAENSLATLVGAKTGGQVVTPRQGKPVENSKRKAEEPAREPPVTRRVGGEDQMIKEDPGPGKRQARDDHVEVAEVPHEHRVDPLSAPTMTSCASSG